MKFAVLLFQAALVLALAACAAKPPKPYGTPFPLNPNHSLTQPKDVNHVSKKEK